MVSPSTRVGFSPKGDGVARFLLGVNIDSISKRLGVLDKVCAYRIHTRFIRCVAADVAHIHPHGNIFVDELLCGGKGLIVGKVRAFLCCNHDASTSYR